MGLRVYLRSAFSTVASAQIMRHGSEGSREKRVDMGFGAPQNYDPVLSNG